jgi:hypothetical protein
LSEANIWIYGCPHEAKDIQYGYKSLETAIRHSISSEFGPWDVAIDLGDHAATQTPPTDEEGVETTRQRWSAGGEVAHKIYPLSGNHCRNHSSDPSGAWFRKYLDPLGENTKYSGITNSGRPYPITGNWERYKIQIGNIVILMMSDVNRPLTAHRGDPGYGGDPGGVVSQSTFDWWKNEVENYRNGPEIVLSCHHYLLKETTIATGEYEGSKVVDGVRVGHFHGLGDSNGQYTSYLAYVDESRDDMQFINHLSAHNGDVAMWFGAHTHVKPGIKISNRSLVEEKYGCTFVNAGSLTAHHGVAGHLYPRSRKLTLTDGSSTASLGQYFHTNTDFSNKGWWPTPRAVNLGKIVQL